MSVRFAAKDRWFVGRSREENFTRVINFQLRNRTPRDSAFAFRVALRVVIRLTRRSKFLLFISHLSHF